MDPFFKMYFLAGLLVAVLVRSVYGKRFKSRAKTAQAHKEPPAMYFLMALWGAAQLLPFFYIFSPWLDFANYSLPVWAQWIGGVVFAFGIWMLWRAHNDLSLNWSNTLSLRQEHTLITTGIYQYIRHPMYAAHIWYGLGQGLLLSNWLAGWLALLAAVAIMLVRAAPEERMMIAQFGDEYRAYMQHTGRFLPKF